jgi:hypothetical protein
VAEGGLHLLALLLPEPLPLPAIADWPAWAARLEALPRSPQGCGAGGGGGGLGGRRALRRTARSTRL